jgi:very-short-patch-repair endonuclease
MTKPEMHRLARNLRKTQTDAEQILWLKLRSRRLSGFKFRRQHPIDNYILDFYCNEAQLAIEIDGGQHAEEKNIKRDC